MKKMISAPLVFLLLLCSACSDSDDDKIILDTDHIKLYPQTEKRIKASHKVQWNSDNDFVASVNPMGKIQANHVGKTYISATSENGEALCLVEVLPRNTLYLEPVLAFGADPLYIKSREPRFLDRSTFDYLTYRGEKSYVNYLTYIFDTNELEGCIVSLDTYLNKDLNEFLTERYLFFYEDRERKEYIFANNYLDQMDMIIGVEYTYWDILITYVPYFEEEEEEPFALYSSESKKLNQFKTALRKVRNRIQEGPAS